MPKPKPKDWIEERGLLPISCEVCEECFMYPNLRCIFGGPFDGYGKTEKETGTGRTVSESEGDSKSLSGTPDEGK